MIARIWRGVTLASKADNYFEFLSRTVIPNHQAAGGNRGIFVLRDIHGDMAHFLLISLWSSHEALTEFAGPDMEIAKQDPEEKNFLIAFESIVKHYEVISEFDQNNQASHYRLFSHLLECEASRLNQITPDPRSGINLQEG